MKKYTMIFVSVILALVTLLIPNQKVKAIRDLTINLDYSSINLNYYNPIFEKLDIIRDFLKDYDDEYDYFLTACQINYFNVILVPKNNNAYFYLRMGENSGDANVYFENNYYIRYSNDISKFNTTFEELKKAVINKNYSYISSSPSSAGAGAVFVSNSNFTGGSILYYTNSKAFWKPDWYLNLNNNILKPNDNIISYYDYINSNKTINITSGFSCDLDGRDMEYVTIDFNDYANEEYTYQYGIKRQAGVDYIKWYDISELSNYMYNFNEYYNGTIIYARVLDSQGNEIAQNQYTINNTELPKFGLNINSGLACPIPNYEGDPQAEIINVDFRNAYFENYKYYYSYDIKTKYQINVTSEQLTHQIVEYLYNFIYFYIYDENDNLIYYTYNDVSSFNRLGTLPDDYEIRHNIEFSDGVACDLEGNKIINVKFDFSNITKFINHYNFDVVINGEHFGAIQYHEITLNEQNYTQNYEVKIYIDTFLYLNRTYSVGGVLGGQDFEDTYDNMLNNGNWKDDLNVENVEDMGDLVIQFLGAISSFIATFFDLLDFFFQRLNFWIRACIITLFIELVICKIIKGVRK